MNSQEKALKVRDYASACNGSESFYRHGLARRLIYSDGVKFLAETSGAFWLVDLVASYVTTSNAVRSEPFSVWTLHAVGESSGEVTCDDGREGSSAIIRQRIEYTDFPRELMPFKLYCENLDPDDKDSHWTLYLPEER